VSRNFLGGIAPRFLDVLFDMGVLVGMDAFGGGLTGRFRVDCE
jgi:hypothetical protein